MSSVSKRNFNLFQEWRSSRHRGLPGQRLGGVDQYALLWAWSSQDAVIAEKTKAPCSRQIRVTALC